jgi:hypothetical protein
MDITTNTQTLITITLSEDEARAALGDPTDLQIGIRAKLYMATGSPLKKNAEAVAVRRNRRMSLGSKRETAAVPKSHRGKSFKRMECPHCHELKSPQGYYKHMAACERKHARVVAETSATSD